MTIELRPLSNALGTEVVGLDLCQPIGDDTFDEINAAWLANNILLFRGQTLTRPQQIAFGRRFGDLVLSRKGANVHPEHPEVLVFSNVEVGGKQLGQRPDETGEGWHSDQIFTEKPPKGSFFYAEEAPQEGGDTLFANQTAAYDALSDDMKVRLDGLTCTYSFYDSWPYLAPNRPPLPPEVREKLPPVAHPLVRTHSETGRKALYAGMRGVSPADEVRGMSVEEGCELLEELRSFATQPQFVYRHHWKAGDAMLWDNRCTMHRASIFDANLGRRHCYRVTIAGGDVPR